MYVKAMHPRRAHQLWEVPAGAHLRYGAITPKVGEHDQSTSDWTWTPLLNDNDVPTMELWVHGDPDIYTDGPMVPAGSMTGSAGVQMTASPFEVTKHYFIKFATWWDPAKAADVTVITGTEGELFIMGDNGRTLDKVA